MVFEKTLGWRMCHHSGVTRAPESRNGQSLQKAFALVELLVIVTFIAILVSLLLPAVQAAREAGRRAQCASNLRQIGLATIGYEEVHGLLPADAYNYDSNASSVITEGLISRGNVLLHIMPFIEQQSLYDQFDFSRPVDGRTFPGTTKRLGVTVIPLYVCPSDQPSQPFWTGGMARQNYMASCGPTRAIDYTGVAPCPMYTTWNAVCHVDEFWNARTPNAGPFTRNCYHCLLTKITDGLSNTILFGEVRPLCSYYVRSGWVVTNNCQGIARTQIPINYNSCSTTSGDCSDYRTFSGAKGFKSCHGAGAQFLFGDGTVRYLAETIDYQTYQYLGDMADGKAFNAPW